MCVCVCACEHACVHVSEGLHSQACMHMCDTVCLCVCVHTCVCAVYLVKTNFMMLYCCRHQDSLWAVRGGVLHWRHADGHAAVCFRSADQHGGKDTSRH